jgi:hypothetical protein
MVGLRYGCSTPPSPTVPPRITPAVSKAKAVAVEERRLQVSPYQRASSGLLALLVTIGSVVSLLLLVWLSSRFFAPQAAAVPVKLVDVAQEGDGGGDGRPTGGSQLDVPSKEPFVGKGKETADVYENLEAVDPSLVAKAAELDEDRVTSTRLGSQGTGGGTGGGTGPGGGQDIGEGNPGHARHWEVLFSRSTLEAYARQLDFFQIELGVVMPDNKIVYAFHLSKPKPDTRTLSNPQVNEKRYYLTWRTGEMQQADRELLTKAGVEFGDHLILKFLPPEIEAQLVALEKSYRGLGPRQIGKTRFGVRPLGDKFEFYVIEQTQKR